MMIKEEQTANAAKNVLNNRTQLTHYSQMKEYYFD